MTERIGAPARTPSPPLASFNDMQKRLFRSHTVSQLKPEGEAAVGVGTKRKLEDYLDPSLLVLISAKIGVPKKESCRKKLMKEEVDDFDWPAEKLKAFGNVEEDIEAADVRSDLDGDGAFSTPFKRFERV